MAEKRRRARRRRRKTAVYTPIAVLLVIFIAIFGMSVFFRISGIVVTGASKYADTDIIAISGIEIGDNLIFMDRNAVALRIYAAMPYVKEVRIERIVPDKININITESIPAASIAADGSRWIIDQDGRVLEKTPMTGDSGIAQVTGITPITPIVGEKLAVADEETLNFTYMTDALNALSSLGFSENTTELDVTNISNITMKYGGRFTVLLGSGENLEYKLNKLKKLIEKLSPDDKGKIDLSGDKSSFIPTY
jgi:cell division septal protein FtsQ